MILHKEAEVLAEKMSKRTQKLEEIEETMRRRKDTRSHSMDRLHKEDKTELELNKE